MSKYFEFKFLDEKHILPQIHELHIIVNNLKAVKIELPKPGAIIAKLPPTWKGYKKRVLHKNEDYSFVRDTKTSSYRRRIMFKRQV